LLAKQDEWEGRLLNGSDYPLPGVMPIFSLDQIVGEGLLDPATLPLLRELRQTNAILFDFVLKRALSHNGVKFPASVFETRDFFLRT
jgi:mannonate dehydratase